MTECSTCGAPAPTNDYGDDSWGNSAAMKAAGATVHCSVCGRWWFPADDPRSNYPDRGDNRNTTTCRQCGAEGVELGWAHVCRPCWDTAVTHDAECSLGSDCDDTLCEHWQ